MSNITDPIKDIFLAGIGALAIGGEKAESLVNQLVEKGQLTVEQGKDIASNLGAKATAQTSAIRDDIIAAQMRVMTKEQRDDLAAKVANLAASINQAEALKNQETAEVIQVEDSNDCSSDCSQAVDNNQAEGESSAESAAPDATNLPSE